MSVENSSKPSVFLNTSFHSMEEVTEVTSATGFGGDFRQLSRGRVTSRWRSLHLGRWGLTSHRLDKRIHVRMTPPKGCVVMGIIPPPHCLFVNGAEVGINDVFLMSADSETEFVTLDDAACGSLILPESDFEACARALFPRTHTNGGPTRLFRCAPSGWTALCDEWMGTLRNGSLSPEDFSHLLSRLLNLMAGESEKRQGETCLDNGTNRRIATRAQEYIEEHYPDVIRMEDLCRCAGVSLRTLQRAFSKYFQMSPSDYIKARRLNAARQALVAADSPSHTVTQIALDSGITHLGRFSVDYREHFGESPSETLARRMSSQLTSRTFDL